MSLELIKSIFFKNFPYKVAALVLTLILWIFVSKDKNFEIGLKASLIIKTKPGLVVSGDVPREILIRVAGPKMFLQPLMLRQFNIKINLADANIGETTFTILKSMIDIPWGVNVTAINPSTVVARIEKIAKKTVPIHPVFEGNLPLGFSIKSQKLSPEFVEISGPRDEIHPVKYINTKPIKLDNITKSFTKSFNLEVPNSKIVLKDTKKTSLEVSITENMSTKTFRKIKLEVFNCLLKCKLAPASINITLKGPKAILQTLTKKDIQVYIDAASKSTGTYTKKAAIKLPARTTVEKVYPIWFKLTVF